MAQTQITEQRPPAYLQPYYENLAGFAQGIAQQPYIPYGGQRIAGFSGLENAAFGGIAALGMGGDPWAFRQAQGAGGDMLGQMQGAGQRGYQDVSGVAGQMGNVRQWIDPGVAGSYMNPYMQNVTDIAAREAGKMGRRQMQDLGSQMALGGSFGGDRHALLQGDIAQNTRQQISDITQQGQAQAYAQGIGAFNQDRNALMNARQQQANAYGMANQLYQSGLGMYNQGVNTMAGLGGQQQAMALGRLGAMGQAGQQQRGLQQAGLDVAFNDYLRQQGYGMDRANFLAGILGGSPYTSQYTNTQTTAQQNPNLFNAMMGAGIGGLQQYQGTQPMMLS